MEIPPSGGIFPKADPLPGDKVEEDVEFEEASGTQNYSSVTTQQGEATIEIDRYLKKGFVKRMEWKEVSSLFGAGTEQDGTDTQAERGWYDQASHHSWFAPQRRKQQMCGRWTADPAEVVRCAGDVEAHEVAGEGVGRVPRRLRVQEVKKGCGRPRCRIRPGGSGWCILPFWSSSQGTQELHLSRRVGERGIAMDSNVIRL